MASSDKNKTLGLFNFSGNVASELSRNWGATISDEYNNGSGNANYGNPSVDASDGWGGYPYGYGYGYGGGYGGGSSGPTESQKKAAENLAPLTVYGQEAIQDKANQMGDVYNIADQGNDNISAYQKAQAERAAGAEWFSRLLKEQSSYKHQRDVMGNARYGSGVLDLNSDFQRIHDANAVDVLEALEQNRADIETDRLSSLQANINARNELAANTEAQLKSNAGDYAAQLNNIHPDLATGDEEGYPQLINAEDRTLNLPDWLNDKWFEEHKTGPVEIPYVSNLTRPGAATELTMRTSPSNVDGTPSDTLFNQWESMLQSLHTNNGSAANRRYWDTLTRDYGHRVV